jgi:hypothetical protein
MSQFESNVEILVSPALPGSGRVSMKTALKRGLIVAASLAMAASVFVGARSLWLEGALVKDAVGGG